jgi:N-acetylglucosamine-6-phosphate deacetylase
LKIAYSAFPSGAILVTDALKFAGLPDGKYIWTNGDEIIKEGLVIKHAHNGRLAGVASSLIECINNFRRFTACGTAAALECVTSHPAQMLGEDVAAKKGALNPGMDADLVVLSGNKDEDLVVEQVWKFGVEVAAF